jgi:CO dehydrogenase maturation factor
MKLFSDQVILLDTPAGMEHFGRAIADGFDTAVVVTDPSYNALSVARESAVLARQIGIGTIILAVNRMPGGDEALRIRRKTGEEAGFTQVLFLPFDPEIARFEPSVIPLLGRESVLVDGISQLTAAVAGAGRKSGVH